MLIQIEQSCRKRVCVKKQVKKSLMCLSRVSSEVELGGAGEGVVTEDSADLLDIFRVEWIKCGE